jgi:WD40 repeat protein
MIGQPLAAQNGPLLSLAFSPDGNVLASGNAQNTVMVWDVQTRRPLGQPFVGHTNWVNTVAFSPDSTTLASGSSDTTIILWDVNLESWEKQACRLANRQMNAEEQNYALQGSSYRSPCSDASSNLEKK